MADHLLLEDGVTRILFEDSSGLLLLEGTSTTTGLSSSLNPSTYLSAVTFTAVVSGSGGTPTGLVVFFDGASDISSGGVTLSSGTAILTTPALSVGSHTITAVYGGDSTFAGSTSNTVTQVVNAPGGTGVIGIGGGHMSHPGFKTGGAIYKIVNTP